MRLPIPLPEWAGSTNHEQIAIDGMEPEGKIQVLGLPAQIPTIAPLGVWIAAMAHSGVARIHHDARIRSRGRRSCCFTASKASSRSASIDAAGTKTFSCMVAALRWLTAALAGTAPWPQ